MWKVSKSVNRSSFYILSPRLYNQVDYPHNQFRVISGCSNATYLASTEFHKCLHVSFPPRDFNYNKKIIQSPWNSEFTRCASFNARRPAQAYVIPGTSAAAVAAGLAQGTVTERQILVDDETLHREELRTWDFKRNEQAMVTLARLNHPGPDSPGDRISSEEVTRLAEKFLGSDRFSIKSSLSHNFGQFQQIISLFLFKVSDIDHPLLHITKIIQSEPGHLEENDPNPYPLWRAMMVLLTAEMFGFPKDIATAPTEIHWAIRDKHNLVGKIAEIMWIAHQLHRRVLDVSTISKNYLSNRETLGTQATIQLLENIHKANKATTLIGDLLLTKKCAYLAALKSPIATELICNSLADYCESEFNLGVKDNNPNYYTYDSWLTRSELGLGSLLGHCMYTSLLFSGFNPTMRKKAFKLGSLLGVLYHAYDDISVFKQKNLSDPSWLDVGTLPVVLYLQNHGGTLEKSHAEIYKMVKSCRSTMAQSSATLEFFKDKVLLELESCNQIGNENARDLLINFVNSLKPVSEEEN